MKPSLSAAADRLATQAQAAADRAGQPSRWSVALDRVAEAVSPRWHARRQQARLQHMETMVSAVFRAAEVSRLTADLGDLPLSGDQAALPELGRITDRVRDAYRNNWAIRSLVSAASRDTVGKGITVRFAARDVNGERLAAFNRKLDYDFRYWSERPELCDHGGAIPLHEILGLAVRDWKQTGSAFILLTYRPREEANGLQLQGLEIEQLATELSQNPDNGHEIRHGCEVDRHGVIQAYWFYTAEHPMEGVFHGRGGKPQRIERHRIIHLKRPDRVRETLPASALTPSLPLSTEQDRYVRSEGRSKSIESCISAQLIEDAASAPVGESHPLGMRGAETSEKITDSRGNELTQLESGLIFKPGRGRRLELMNPQRPGGQYAAYMDQQNQMIAAGADCGVSKLTRKYTSSYTAERRSLIEDGKTVDTDQELIKCVALRAIVERFTAYQIVEGRVQPGTHYPLGQLRDPESRRYLMECEMQPPPVQDIDPARAAARRKIDLDYKVDNRGRILNEDGLAWRENFDDIAEQAAYAQELGITLPEAGADAKVSAREPRPRGQANSPNGASARHPVMQALVGGDDPLDPLTAAIVSESFADEGGDDA